MMIRFGSRSSVARRRSLAGIGLAVAVGLGLAVALLAGPATVASAAPSMPSNCAQASVGANVTCSFGYNGAEQTFTVPAGVSQVTLTATGASGGGDSFSGSGGFGGVATDTATVTPGQTLYIEVGGQGGSVGNGVTGGAGGGFGGGGGGGNGSPGEPPPDGLPPGNGGPGGGGASDVRTAPGSSGLTPTDPRLVVGGGGGGGGCCSVAGGSAGSAGGNGSSGGGAGTQSSGGMGGQASFGQSGGNGTLGTGGSGGNGTTPAFIEGGGGGGGGYYGGGGGAANYGGGGGSSYAPGGSTSLAAAAGNGSVTIAFTPPAGVAGMVLLPASASVAAGSSQTFQAATVDAFGATLADVTAQTAFSAGAPASCVGASCGAPTPGSYAVTGTDGSLTAGAALTVTQAAPTVALSAGPAGGATTLTPVTLTASVAGVAGVAPPGGTVTFAGTGVPSSCSAVDLSGGQAACSLGDLATGSYDFAASYSGDTNYTAGSPATVTGYSVDLAATSVGIAQSVPAPVYGQPLSVTATVTSGTSPANGGSVQWQLNAAPDGSPVQVSSAGTAGLDLSGLAAGSYTVFAGYSGTTVYAASSSSGTVVIGPAATGTGVSVTSSELTATISATPPGAGTPTGSVAFAVNGTPVGTAPLSGGVASLAYTSSGAETVSAAYGGSTNFQPSSGSTATANPKITATVSSAHPETTYGWYNGPVTVGFTCTPGSAPLTAPCPQPVTLSQNGADQSVTRTIHGTDGGIATVTVSPLNIDQTPPVLHVTGAVSGRSYDAPGPEKLACTASDSLSGLATPCALTVTRTASRVSWRATVTDEAGTTATVSGHAALIDYYIAGAPRRHGLFVVAAGHTYRVVAYVATRRAPQYAYAAPVGAVPHPVGPAMTSIGTHLWAIRTTIITEMTMRYRYWHVGVLVGGHMHLIALEVSKA
jgi:hypothetical protein